MRQLKRQMYKCPLAGLIIVGLSACSSGDTENPADAVIVNDASAINASSDSITDSPGQPVDENQAGDDQMLIESSPENSQMPVGSSRNTRDIAGLWDVTQSISGDNTAQYVLIGANGELTEFDYQGDSTGNGGACYTHTIKQIVSRGADQFDIENDSVLPGSEGSEDVMINVEDNTLFFRYFALIPAPEGGEEMSPRTAQFPASDIALDDLRACG